MASLGLAMTRVLLCIIPLILGVTRVAAAPRVAARSTPSFIDPSSVTTLSASDVSSFEPYEQFARATYCSGVADWSCGGKSIVTCSSFPTHLVRRCVFCYYRLRGYCKRW